ncbi:MAG: hypothetical protein HY294_10910 [Candidatus Rokubacteria bacterium]|nr:hypothetical protein [Candidatus Rokubacteria bacterium]MBI3826495.1 hypothetical protein [Candidatus Rokubacteria bacterium]
MRLLMVADGDEIARRRSLLPKDQTVEAWPDLYLPGLYWLGEEAKAALDGVGEALTAHMSVDDTLVPIFYGRRLTDVDSLPREASLKARVLSGHGIAAAWATVDREGRRHDHQPQRPTDPLFYLRRIGGGAAHLWRLFASRDEARAFMAEHHGDDDEGLAWVAALPRDDWDDLVRQAGAR